MRRVRATIVAVEKQYIIHIVSVCVLVLGIRHEMRLHHIVICALAGFNIFFSTLSHKRHDFRKYVIEHKMCVLVFYRVLSETFLTLCRTERDNDRKCILVFM